MVNEESLQNTTVVNEESFEEDNNGGKKNPKIELRNSRKEKRKSRGFALIPYEKLNFVIE